MAPKKTSKKKVVRKKAGSKVAAAKSGKKTGGIPAKKFGKKDSKKKPLRGKRPGIKRPVSKLKKKKKPPVRPSGPIKVGEKS